MEKSLFPNAVCKAWGGYVRILIVSEKRIDFATIDSFTGVSGDTKWTHNEKWVLDQMEYISTYDDFKDYKLQSSNKIDIL